VRPYTVQAGDSPAGLASTHAGCPKCARDLVTANPHKPTVVYPNGFISFAEFRAGEKINLPTKWFDGTLDTRPAKYFAALPYADGVTPSTLGDAAVGILGDFSNLDAATTAVSVLDTLDDETFTHAADNAANLIDGAVSVADGDSAAASSRYARDTHTATAVARQRLVDMRAALDVGDQAGAKDARYDVRSALVSAVGSARLSLQAFYGGSTTPAPQPPSSNVLVSAAQAAANAIGADTSYCTSVASAGSAVNSAVHAFKTAWNASGQSPLPINTGNYEQSVANAIASLVGTAPPGCGSRATPSPQPQQPTPQPVNPNLVAVTVPTKQGLSRGEIFGLSLIGATAAGGAIYLATRKPRKRRRG